MAHQHGEPGCIATDRHPSCGGHVGQYTCFMDFNTGLYFCTHVGGPGDSLPGEGDEEKTGTNYLSQLRDIRAAVNSERGRLSVVGRALTEAEYVRIATLSAVESHLDAALALLEPTDF